MAEKWPKIAQKLPKMAQKLAPAKKIAEIYLQYLQLFASLVLNQSVKLSVIFSPRRREGWPSVKEQMELLELPALTISSEGF